LLGKPIVATDVGWNREMLELGATGELVPTRNPRALAGAIVQSLADRGAMAIRAEEQIPAIRRNSDPASSARQTDALIREVFELAR